MHLILVVVLALLVSGVGSLPVGTQGISGNSVTTETPECPLESAMNKTRCIVDVVDLTCNDMTTEICTCPVNYFCHFDNLSVCYFTCLDIPTPQRAAHEFNMNMLRGSEVPGFLDEISED